jgi:hypothetical protein
VTVTALEREVLSWVGSMVRPTTGEIVRKVKLTNPKAARLSVSRALKSLEARGAIVDTGEFANSWELP